jgi:hypothetical protein
VTDEELKPLSRCLEETGASKRRYGRADESRHAAQQGRADGKRVNASCGSCLVACRCSRVLGTVLSSFRLFFILIFHVIFF